MNFLRCNRCIYDTSVAYITFDEHGICNYCRQIDELIKMYGTGSSRGKDSEDIVAAVKRSGSGKKYDCILGVSGGTDSSYLAYLLIKWGLRPLAVHYDNTWNSAVATQNIGKVLNHLGIDLYTHVVANKESDDIFKSFFLAGVQEIEAPTDLGLAETMYRAANKFGIKYIFEGHSFVTEGITPLGRNYFDGRYIKSIHNQFGVLPMKTYPLMTFLKFLRWTVLSRIQKIRPFWYIDYSKESARAFLQKEFDWKYYGGHHLENRMSAFSHSVYAPQKFKTDFRINTLAALVRNGALDRELAINEFENPPAVDETLILYFRKRLKLTDSEYKAIMALPPKSWTDFKTYKKYFEALRPLFLVLAKANLVPMSFYLKYCFPVEAVR